MKLIKIILVFLLIGLNIISKLYSINSSIYNIIVIVLTSFLIFIIAQDNNKKNIINYISMFLFWNITFSVVELPVLRTSNLLKIISYTISLKYIYLDIFAALFIGSILQIIVSNKKFINIIFEIILICFSIKLDNVILFYSAIYLLSTLLKLPKDLNKKSYIFTILNNLSLGLFLFHKIIINLIINFNIIKSNNIFDCIGAIVLTYLLGFILSFSLKTRPILNNII